MKEISKKALERIKKEKIEPTPKWKFLLKDYITWFSFVLSIIIGSFGFAMVLFMLLNHDWDIYRYLNRTFIEHLLVSLPYLWILFLLFFIFLADYNLKHTKRGYRYKTYLVLLASIIISLIMGSLLYYFGIGTKINDIFAHNFPYYRRVFYPREEIWNNPEKGLLAGIITNVKSENEFSLKDFKEKIWQIEAKDAYLKKAIIIREGEKIKIIGELKSINIFIAKEIRPWVLEPRGPRNGRFGPEKKSSPR